MIRYLKKNFARLASWKREQTRFKNIQKDLLSELDFSMKEAERKMKELKQERLNIQKEQEQEQERIEKMHADSGKFGKIV